MTVDEKPSPAKGFRVVVIGGGVAGLTASHALQLANIDHVVLERGEDPAPPMGSSIGLLPHGLRILQQFGCYDQLARNCKPIEEIVFSKIDGSVFLSSPMSKYLFKNHGMHMLAMSRQNFLRGLYDGLPDKSYVKTGRKVRTIQHFDDHVEVVLADGTVERGDIVIGCDGIRSLTRRTMWELADAQQPGWIPSSDKTEMTVTWKCLTGIGPPEDALANGKYSSYMIFDKDRSVICSTQPDAVYWFFFFRLKPEMPCPDRNPYSEQDADDLALSVKDVRISDDLTFGDLWARKRQGFLVPIEEGVLKKWHYGNIVLAGDACHKMTPHCALGGNSAMESIVVICNKLKDLLDAKAGQRPNRQELDAIFESYQQDRIDRAKKMTQGSGLYAKLQGFETWWHKLIAVRLMPWLPESFMANSLGGLLKDGHILTYGKEHTFPSGKVAWTHV